MRYIAKVALTGFDSRTATPEQCAVHSDFPPLKSKIDLPSPHNALLLVDFTSTITQNIDHTLYKIPHGYGYVPFTLADIVLHITGQDVVGIGYAGVGANLYVKAYCDSDFFYVKIYDNFNWITAASSLEVSYYIFAENGS